MDGNESAQRQEQEGRDPAGNHSTYPSPTSYKRTPHPGLHRTREGGPAWEAGLAKLRERVEQGWRGLEGTLDRMGPSQNSQEDIPTLVYNALLGKLTNE